MTRRFIHPRREYYTSVELAYLSGLTYRQLDYRTRYGYLTPSIAPGYPGGLRLFSAQDVVAARIYALLGASADRGGVPTWMRGATPLIQAAPLEGIAGHALVVTGGHSALVAHSDLPEFLTGRRDLVTVIPLDQCLTGLVEDSEWAGVRS